MHHDTLVFCYEPGVGGRGAWRRFCRLWCVLTDMRPVGSCRTASAGCRHLDVCAVDWLLQDPPFGIHLCGNDACVVPGGPIQPTHDERVRPYRGIPIFCADTIVQHYLAPEEMAPYHQQVSFMQEMGACCLSSPSSPACRQAGSLSVCLAVVLARVGSPLVGAAA